MYPNCLPLKLKIADDLTGHQLPCPDRGFDHGVHQGHAQAAFFQFHQTFDGAARRRCDGVFKQRRMMSGLKGELGRAIQRLRGQSCGHFTRKPTFTPASARDSKITNTNAGPLAESAVMASMCFSSTIRARPTLSNRCLAVSTCWEVAAGPPQTAVIAAPTMAGVLGIARTTGMSLPSFC